VKDLIELAYEIHEKSRKKFECNESYVEKNRKIRKRQGQQPMNKGVGKI